MLTQLGYVRNRIKPSVSNVISVVVVSVLITGHVAEAVNEEKMVVVGGRGSNGR